MSQSSEDDADDDSGKETRDDEGLNCLSVVENAVSVYCHISFVNSYDVVWEGSTSRTAYRG